uniref:VPS9 domain-containing protein n=1 Tax=Magallana gigas TaxID=29159 RepID=K1QYC6_MAGGI|eukprot:XP_011456166.1 PREDICTED: uncharacterized protein LOC105348448 [Crassostrea gigas]
MNLNLRHGDSLEQLKVVLKDWYRPMIDDVGNDLQLEPAIWFKSLFIDAIFIDGNCREVRVRMEPGDSVREVLVFEDYDYNELDPKAQELFDATRELLISMGRREFSKKQFKTELLRLLHCYIMPSILLTVDDMSNLHNALCLVEKQLKSIEQTIEEKGVDVHLKESSLAKKQKEILENEDFTSETYILSCNPKFLQEFEKHIEKDVKEACHVFDAIQRKVDELKLSNSTADELGLVRKERDACHENLVKIKTIQESIKHAKKSKQLLEADTTNDCHQIYIEINEQLQEEMEELHRLCLHKAKISSVREAIKQALDDLKTDGQTFGWQMKSDGTAEHDTDVIGMNYKPKDWYTLEETIFSIFADITNDVTERHFRFCSGIHDKIAAVLKETEDQASGDMIGHCTMDIPEDEKNDPRRQETVFQSPTDAIKREVNDHLLSMVKLLSLAISKNSCHGTAKSNISGKIAIYYHNILCHKIMEPLESLYDKTYGRICVNVFNKTKDMSFEELGIDEPWIRCLNDPSASVHVTGVKRPVESVHSITSGLSQQSIDKRECEELGDCWEFEVRMHPSTANDTKLEHQKGTGMVDDLRSENNSDNQTLLNVVSPSTEKPNNLPPFCGGHCTSAKNPVVQEGGSLYDILQPGLDLVHTLVRETTITGKLKMITKTYRFVRNQVSDLKSAASLQDFKSSHDELLMLLIVLFTFLDERDFKRLFIQMYLMEDFKPGCILGGVHDYSLTYFFTAFRHFQDRLPSRHTTLYQR